MNVMMPRLKPVAPDTWEVRAQLPNTEEETARISLECPGPQTVVGLFVAVTNIQPFVPGLVSPLLDDILVLVDLDNQRRFTSGPTQGQTSAASRSSSYVTLSTLDSRVRDLYWNLESPRPVLGFTFRWKQFLEGTPFYQGADISISVFCLPGTVIP